MLVGLTAEVLQWWQNNRDIIPVNTIFADAIHVNEWFFNWNQRENSRQALESYLLHPSCSFDKYRRIQSIMLARTFLFIDLLHKGFNVWMLDGDVVFPIDPKRMFLDRNFDCVYMMNVGQFPQGGVRYEVPYSYPFLIGGRHATVNNGIVASRATLAAQKLWEKSIERVLNHVTGDPQHPHNQLLFTLGLNLKKVSVEGYPILEGDLGYYQGNVSLHEKGSSSLPLTVRTISTVSGMDQVGIDVINRSVAFHAVGVGGLSAEQGVKCEHLKKIQQWYLNASCA